MQELDKHTLDRISQLENKVEALRAEIEKLLNQAKVDNFKVASRLEALIRHLIFTKSININSLLDMLNAYSEFRNTLLDIAKIESIPEKIERARFHNNKNIYYHFKIYADDLNLKELFEKSGGPSKIIAKDLIENFEKSTALFDYLYPFAYDNN
jgi:hypothetical protein